MSIPRPYVGTWTYQAGAGKSDSFKEEKKLYGC